MTRPKPIAAPPCPPAALAAAFAVALLAALPARAQERGPQDQHFTAASLNLDAIEKSIDTGVKALYKIEPTYTFLPGYLYEQGNLSQELRNMMGNHALACWALLAAGESYQNPPLYRRINWVLSSDANQTYDRGMRLQMLAELPRERWKPWVHRDKVWLVESLTQAGNFGDSWFGTVAFGPGDNASGQYGVLGLWGCERAGDPIGVENWRKIDAYWRAAQQKPADPADPESPAGWGVYTAQTGELPSGASDIKFNKRTSGPMTAGGVAVLSLTERYLYGSKIVDDSLRKQIPHLRRGLRWLDQNFSLTDKAEESDRYYYFWTLQRVGHATGFRTFNGVDWFRDITALMLNEQTADGSWHGDKGTLLSTGFALLYLSHAYDPLAVSKIRLKGLDTKGRFFDSGWNNRPHDVWNFVDYASDTYEESTTWQIVEPDQPIYELIESPILYLSTGDHLKFTPAQIQNLHDYIQAGGLLVLNPEGTDTSATTFKDLLAGLMPLFHPLPHAAQVKPDDPLMTVHQTVHNLPMRVYDNGVRPLVVEFFTDVGQGLQSNEPYGRAADDFKIMSNLYLYVTGMNPRRVRLKNNYVPRLADKPRIDVPCARIKTTGNFDPEPGALEQLSNILANTLDINLQVDPALPAGKLSNQRIAFLTTTGDGQLAPEEALAIRKWVDAGGTLWIDAAGGSAAASANARKFLQAIVPDIKPAPLSSDSLIIDGRAANGTDDRFVRYRNFTLNRVGRANTPKLQGVEINGRIAVVFSADDLTSGLAGLDHWNIFGYSPESARQLVVNGVLDMLKTAGPK